MPLMTVVPSRNLAKQATLDKSGTLFMCGICGIVGFAETASIKNMPLTPHEPLNEVSRSLLRSLWLSASNNCTRSSGSRSPKALSWWALTADSPFQFRLSRSTFSRMLDHDKFLFVSMLAPFQWIIGSRMRMSAEDDLSAKPVILLIWPFICATP